MGRRHMPQPAAIWRVICKSPKERPRVITGSFFCFSHCRLFGCISVSGSLLIPAFEKKNCLRAVPGSNCNCTALFKQATLKQALANVTTDAPLTSVEVTCGVSWKEGTLFSRIKQSVWSLDSKWNGNKGLSWCRNYREQMVGWKKTSWINLRCLTVILICSLQVPDKNLPWEVGRCVRWKIVLANQPQTKFLPSVSHIQASKPLLLITVGCIDKIPALWFQFLSPSQPNFHMTSHNNLHNFKTILTTNLTCPSQNASLKSGAVCQVGNSPSQLTPN